MKKIYLSLLFFAIYTFGHSGNNLCGGGSNYSGNMPCSHSGSHNLSSSGHLSGYSTYGNNSSSSSSSSSSNGHYISNYSKSYENKPVTIDVTNTSSGISILLNQYTTKGTLILKNEKGIVLLKKDFIGSYKSDRLKSGTYLLDIESNGKTYKRKLFVE